jgi:hypothetical protein
MAELSSPAVDLKSLVAGAVDVMPVTWLDDAKSLVTHLHSDAGQVADRRLRVVMAALREMLMQENTTLQWCDTSVQLADALTKWDAERGYLLEAMRSGLVSLRMTPDAVKTKAAIREARHRRADEARRSRKDV